MMDSILYKNVRVPESIDISHEKMDLLIEEGVIHRINANIDEDSGEVVIDASGMLILPGLFDLHVHLREPGREDTETIATGTEAAINGGITGVLSMPNTDPAVDTGSMVEFIQDIADEEARIPVLTSGCITKGRQGNELAEIGDMFDKGAPMITDDGDPVSNPRVLRRAMEYSKGFDLIVAEHCEIPELSTDGAVNEGSTSYRLGLPGQPSISEEICIERDIKLAELTGVQLHIHHLSTEGGLESIRQARNRGVNVTCEVTPHHLLFSEKNIKRHDTSLKMNPPLRSERDQEALLEGLKNGDIDIIATDHAPHANFEKRKDFNSAPFGIIGLETAIISLYDRFVSEGRLSWSTLIETFSREPRCLLGRDPVEFEEGREANFFLFDPNDMTLIDEDFLCSKSQNTPFFGSKLQGSIQIVQKGSDILLDRNDRAQE